MGMGDVTVGRYPREHCVIVIILTVHRTSIMGFEKTLGYLLKLRFPRLTRMLKRRNWWCIEACWKHGLAGETSGRIELLGDR